MRVLAIAKKELLQLQRDRLTLAMTVVLPLVQLLILGFAINTDVRNSPLVVLDQDRSAASRDLARRLEITGFYRLVGEARGYDEIERALRSGRARVGLVVPPHYAADLRAGRTAKAQLIVDGSDPQTVASASNTAASLVQARAAELLVERLGGGRAQAPIQLDQATWYNPELRTAVFIVPGLIGVLLTMTMVMLTSIAMARERERGTLEQLIVSPVTRLELVAGKILPYIAAGYVQMTLILLAGRWVFHVPFVGSLSLLYAVASLFISANLAVGLIISTVAKTQQQAMQMSFFFLLPNVLLSGFMFPFDAMPAFAKAISNCLPLTHFLAMVRGITLKAATLPDLRRDLVWLSGILIFLVTMGFLRMSKKLDQ
jgi:ABC-2 type transport system permease protein